MSKIEWTDITWNPVWGCNTGCPYCYARKFSKRFIKRIAQKEYQYVLKGNEPEFNDLQLDALYRGNYIYDNLRNFKPTWLESNFHKKFPKKSKRIFVNSMSDVYWWKPEWMKRVLERIKEYPQHTFLFLTKFPKVYIKYDFPKNCWLGFTATNRDQLDRVGMILLAHNHYYLGRTIFLSVEPIQEKMWSYIYKQFNWVIIGAETGHRLEKVVPEYEWILDIASYCLEYEIPVFMKDNLQFKFKKSLKELFTGKEIKGPCRFDNKDLIQEFPEGR